ncbi:hypothetical protein C448_10417 [Halococcus morrhuae DSM 1307]|uniref:DUF7282 domain-containing protein n=2 Tax=Halococcus morrhuae TaxID=2250 RepID=M0MC18_HALMO|nr:hypothetical protein C448_10417 [Halococcus morrhuae DSM 1307]
MKLLITLGHRVEKQMNTAYRNSVFVVVLLAATALAPGIAVGIVSQPIDGDVSAQQNATDASANASVTLTNQTRTGRSVFVDRATLPEGGFVVLSEAGENGSIVGVSLPLSAGTHEGKVTLRGAPGNDLNRTRLGTNTTLVATLHRDSNDNGRFDGLLTPDADEPYGNGSTPARDRATVTVATSDRPANASVTLSNRTSDGTTVTVDRATLPDGGYVTVHDEEYNGSNATETLIGATGYLDAGSYENVTVGVAGENDSAPVDSGRISVVIHEDTDGDRAFQYMPSDGVEDQPARANGSPVADAASLTVERPSTPTPTATATSSPTETDTATTATAEPTATDTPTATPPQEPADESTPYGGESSGREGILDNPLFPVIIGVFALFAVLTVVTR